MMKKTSLWNVTSPLGLVWSGARRKCCCHLSAFLVFILLLATAWCAYSEDQNPRPVATNKSHSDSPSIVELGPAPCSITRKVNVPFHILSGGTMVLGIPKGVIPGDPIEGYERPFLVYGTRALLLDDFAALRGRVQIRTPAEALAFCRLRTSLVTYHVWGETRLEVVCRDQVDVGFCFGDKKKCSWLRTLESGYYGIVHARSELTNAGIKQASVRVTSNGFEIRRTLLIGRPLDVSTKNHIVQARELVTRDGGYKVLSATSRPVPRITGVTWVLPIIM